MKNSKLIIGLILLSMGFGAITEAQDWAGLNRFKDENAKLGSPAGGDKRIVFMGNSITEAWETICPGFFRFRADVINLKPAVVLIMAGYQVMAPLAEAAIAKALLQKY
jgi:hypothetical protein